MSETFVPEYKKSIDDAIILLEKNKLEAQAVNNPKAYVKNQVAANGPLWWSHWREDMDSDDPSIRRNAMIEYNKLQARVLPTELTGPDGGGILTTIISYTAESTKQIDDTEASSASFIDVVSSEAPV